MRSSASLMSGVPELIVLRLLSTREMYGYELARRIRETTREAISLGEGVLYPALHVMETRGLLRTRRRAVAGRTRVYYAITPKGRRRLAALSHDWRRIARGVESVLAGAPLADARVIRRASAGPAVADAVLSGIRFGRLPT